MTTIQRRKAVLFGLAGITLILFGLKAAFAIGFEAPQTLLMQEGRPALLFLNVNDGCECMMELAHSADAQIASWIIPSETQNQIITIDFDLQKDLTKQYQVFRAPALVLLDAAGQIVHRQDYPLTEGGPFDLKEFETAIIRTQSAVKP